MQRLEPGLYVDHRKAVHIDEVEFLEARGFPVTQANIEMVRKTLIEEFPNATIEEQ
jgi:hypothetical protein